MYWSQYLSENSVEDAEWTDWTGWDGCRDDRLPSYGKAATDASYLCITTDAGSNNYIFNRRYRTCQNRISNTLKYARYGGINSCLGTQTHGNEQDDIHEERPCSSLPSCPRM